MSPLPQRGEPQSVPPETESLSAWMDGELDEGQARALLDRLKQDAELRAHFEWLQVASDAMRSHEVAACHVPRLASRVSLALQSEPALLAPRALSGASVRRHVVTGMTVAAAAALLVVVAVPQLRGPAAPPVGAVPPVASNAAAVRPSAPRNPQLEAYFRAHRELETTGVMPAAAAYIRFSGEPER
jgi:sigma-E factor negative regulatory protein RseA